MRASLGTLLIQAGVASEEDVRKALDEGQQTGERLGEIVIRKGLATDELFETLRQQTSALSATLTDGAPSL